MNKKKQHAVIATPSDKIYFAVVSNSENTEWHTIQQQNKESDARWNEWACRSAGTNNGKSTVKLLIKSYIHLANFPANNPK